MKKKLFLGMAVLALAGSLLTGCKAVREYTGEYAYSTEYGNYGAKVTVFVRGDKIERVEVVDADYQRVSEGWEGRDIYLAGEQALLDSFAGKSVAEVKKYSVTKEGNVPASVKAEGLAVVTGATQSTGRLLLAVQNALAKI